MIIPKIQFQQAKLNEVLAFFHQASRDLDAPKTPENLRGINFIMHGNPEDLPAITFSMRNVSMLDALRNITDIASMTISTQGETVVIKPGK